MSSRSYRPPPGQDSSPSSRRPSPFDGESDLFGHRPSQAPPAASRPPPSLPPAPSGPGLLGGRMIGAAEDAPAPAFSKGARDENSVLFSVKDLVSAAQLRKSTAPPPSEASQRPFGNDPTGLVDLNAIAQTTHSSLEIKPLDIASLRPSVVPMPVQHASSMWPSQEAPPTRWERFTGMAKGPRAPLFFGAIAIAALVFVGFGAALTAWAMSDSGAELSASIAPPPPESDVIEREVVQRTKVAEAPEATPSQPARHGAGRSHVSGHASFGKSSSKSSAKGPKPVPKKASDPCNCRGVLACAMRCTK